MTKKQSWPPAQARCQKCGYTNPSYAKVERHVDLEHGSGRIETVIVRTDEPKPA